MQVVSRCQGIQASPERAAGVGARIIAAATLAQLQQEDHKVSGYLQSSWGCKEVSEMEDRQRINDVGDLLEV